MALPAGHLHRYGYADYLRLEEDSAVRHEFLDGEIYAMAGGTPEHAALAMSVGTALGRRIESGPCHVFSSDLRVRVLQTGLATYPDLTVVCGPTERDPDSRTTVTNPTVVVEITSESTEDYDRNGKLDHYRQIPSLRAYVIVSHREPRLDLWQRAPGGPWQMVSFGKGESPSVEAIGCTLSVDQIYGSLLAGV